MKTATHFPQTVHLALTLAAEFRAGLTRAQVSKKYGVSVRVVDRALRRLLRR